MKLKVLIILALFSMAITDDLNDEYKEETFEEVSSRMNEIVIRLQNYQFDQGKTERLELMKLKNSLPEDDIKIHIKSKNKKFLESESDPVLKLDIFNTNEKCLDNVKELCEDNNAKFFGTNLIECIKTTINKKLDSFKDKNLVVDEIRLEKYIAYLFNKVINQQDFKNCSKESKDRFYFSAEIEKIYPGSHYKNFEGNIKTNDNNLRFLQNTNSCPVPDIVKCKHAIKFKIKATDTTCLNFDFKVWLKYCVSVYSGKELYNPNQRCYIENLSAICEPNDSCQYGIGMKPNNSYNQTCSKHPVSSPCYDKSYTFYILYYAYRANQLILCANPTN